MRKSLAASVCLSLVAACAMGAHFFPANAQAPAGAREAAGHSSEPYFLEWPLPETGKAYGDIDGKHLWQYVKEQGDIALRYRDQGHPQYWGRISGTSGDVDDVQWLLEKYRTIGLTDVHAQTVAFFNPQWAPKSWEVTAIGGGQTMQLTSAQPPYGGVPTNGKSLDLPIAYLGFGSEADFQGRDVRGKAVLLVRNGSGYVIGPADVLKRAMDHGAAAILETDMRGGNYKAFDYESNYREPAHRNDISVPTFNLGTRDGLALRDMIGKAAADNPPHVQIRLDAAWESGQKGYLVWGTLPGATDETIYVLAHRDGWFQAAGDNASGVATMLGLAEHFAKIPRSQRRRTIIFIGTDGHHHIPQGGYGREWLLANRDKFFSKTALIFNSEHTSEVLTRSVSAWTEETTPMDWYAGGPSRPQLAKIALDAFHEFGVPITPEPGRGVPGNDLGPFGWFLPGVNISSDGFVYMHTDSDDPDTVPWTGLEASTRAYARIIDEVNKLPLADLQRPPDSPAYRPYLDLTGCEAWIKDSSVPCKPKT